MTPALSAVVPCLNEAATLRPLIERLVPACRAVAGERFEIVLVDDGSTDGTFAAMTALQRAEPRIVAVRLSRNHGHQLALSAGLAIATGARVLVLDADLQDPPELLPELWARMDAGFDVVIGRRRARAGESRFKTASAAAFYRLMHRIGEVAIPVDAGDFRLMSRRVVDALNAMPERQRFVRGMVSWVGFAQTTLPYDRAPRVAGDSKYRPGRMLAFALDAVASFSTVPLRLATWIGLALSLAAGALMVAILVTWFSGETVQGWTSLMLVVLFIGGVQSLMIGILGEYVGRLYVESKRRPLYLVDEVRRAGGGD